MAYLNELNTYCEVRGLNARDLGKFKADCDVIMADRWSDGLSGVADKVYIRDLFKKDWMMFGKLNELSVIKTLRFNLHYFGVRGFRLPVLVSRNFVLLSLKGACFVDDFRLGSVRLGFSGVGIFDKRYDRGIWECGGEVEFKGKASLGQGAKISVGADGRLVIGNNFRVTAKSEIICCEKVEIGDDVLMSWDSIVMDTDFHQIDDGPRTAPVFIGSDVWVGMRATILKGSVIPAGSVIAAESIVAKAFDEERCLYGGVNHVLKHDVEWTV